MFEETFRWLEESLVRTPHELKIPFQRKGITWMPVAGFSRCGSILAIYENQETYCAHGGDIWFEEEEPNLGYHSKNLSWIDLLHEIARNYDEIKERKD